MTTKETIATGRPPGTASPEKPTAGLALLTAAASLGFRATARDRSGSTLGVLVDTAGAAHHLTISPEGAWTLSNAPTASRRAFLLSESAANVLRGGHLDPDGSIAYAGSSYALEPSADGETRTAKLHGAS